MQKEKELVIRMDEAEKDLEAAVISIIQKHNLPFFIFEPIFDKIHRQLLDGKASELENAKSRHLSKEEKT